MEFPALVKGKRVVGENTSKEAKTKFYNDWSEKYDKEMNEVAYNGPATITEEMEQLFSSSRDNVRILDVGAGTGLVMEELSKSGFTNVDALDPSPGMLEQARKKNLYKNVICQYINENQLPIEKDTYDAIVTCGCFGTGHIPCNALFEMIRLVRPGGFVVILTIDSHLLTFEEYKDRFYPLVNKLESQGHWIKIKNQTTKNYFGDKSGKLLVYRIC